MYDIRFALRTLARNPGFTLTALLTLALGIGANAAMFSVVNGVLLRALPYPDAERLVRVHLVSPERGVTEAALSLVDVEDWRAQARSFEGVAGSLSSRVTLTGGGDVEEFANTWVTADFFHVLGTPAQVGRTFTREEARTAARLVVLSDGAWRGRFGGDRAIVGSTLTLDGELYTVAGVMPREFRYPSSETAFWMPISILTPDDIGPRARDNRFLAGLARLRPDVSIARAESELTALAARLAKEHPGTNEGWDMARVVGLQQAIVGDVDTALLVMLGVVGFVLLIACANLANLLLARATTRTREIAVRTALGAGRARLVRQFLTESLVLAGVGGALGVAVSLWAVDAVVQLSAETLPRVEDIRLDWAVLGYSLVITLLTGLLFGIVPALRATRGDTPAALRGGRGAVGADRQRPRAVLVAGEISLAVVLVVGAGLMARSFLALRSVDPGFDPERVLTVTLRISLPPGPAPEQVDSLRARKQQLIDRVAAVPGVEAVGSIQRLPLHGAGEAWEFVRADAPDGGPIRTDARFVNAAYFRAMGIPVVAGRIFDEARADGAPPQIVLSATAARRFWPGEHAVGKNLRLGTTVIEVAGVVGDVRQRSLASEPEAAVYVSQQLAPRAAVNLVVRTAEAPVRLAPSVRAAIREADPSQPIAGVATLGEVVSESVAQERFFSVLFVIFGAVALALAGIGVYGVLAYSVEQRTQEFGLRMALGAHGADVLRMVIASSLGMVALGVIVGVAAALALTRLLASLLYGVGPTDPMTFAGVVALLLLVALVAAYLPARRATRVDPMVALRAE